MQENYAKPPSAVTASYVQQDGTSQQQQSRPNVSQQLPQPQSHGFVGAPQPYNAQRSQQQFYGGTSPSTVQRSHVQNYGGGGGGGAPQAQNFQRQQPSAFGGGGAPPAQNFQRQQSPPFNYVGLPQAQNIQRQQPQVYASSGPTQTLYVQRQYPQSSQQYHQFYGHPHQAQQPVHKPSQPQSSVGVCSVQIPVQHCESSDITKSFAFPEKSQDLLTDKELNLGSFSPSFLSATSSLPPSRVIKIDVKPDAKMCEKETNASECSDQVKTIPKVG